MALELIVNLLLIAGGIFCFVNVSTTMPHSAVNELGAEQWPQAILVLMLIALAFNVIRFFKINKKEDIKAGFQDFFPAIGRFVKSKLFLGMVLVVVMALMYEPVGFMLTCLLFLFAYGLLLGQRNIPMLILSSVIITIILYIGFAVFLGVLLPRGQILPLRNFALYVTPEIDPQLGDYSFKEICSVVHHRMGLDCTAKLMGTRIAANVSSEKAFILKVMPLFIKNAAMKAVFDAVGERKSCLCLSNLGNVTVPQAMRPYISRMDFIIGVQARAPHNCGVLSYNGTMYINMIRNITEPELELHFFRVLQDQGLHVKAESNQP